MKTAIEIRKGIEAGEFTALSVLEECLAVIKEKDGEIGAFLEVYEEDAREQAQAIDAMVVRGESLPRLAGIPVAIKDNYLMEGKHAAAGSSILKDYVSAYDSTVVRKLKDAGAVIIGRVNMDDAAMGSSTETSAFQKTRNPHDLTKVPGGSSGGSAAAVAAGMAALAIGSDTGGSIRQPASLCGVVGYKPTYGAVSRYGVIALASSLDHMGPLARTVGDVALLFEVMQGQDAMDATSFAPTETYVPELAAEGAEVFAGLKIGVPKEYFLDEMDTEVRARVEEGIERMRKAGAEIVPISLPLTEYALPTYYIIQPAEASSNLGRYDGLRYGTRAPGALESSYLEARKLGFGKEVKRRIMLGSFILSAGYYDAYYKKAQAVRTKLHEEIKNAFTQVDFIVSPTAPTVAWNLGEKMDDPIAMYLADIFTVTADLVGNPAISVPCGTAHNLPVGIQLMANHKEDAKLLKIAHAFERLA